jgi:hypothetical protein
MSDANGRTDAKELWLDMLCLDPKTHRIVSARNSEDGRDIELLIEGPDMPEVTSARIQPFTPVYRKKDWERLP